MSEQILRPTRRIVALVSPVVLALLLVACGGSAPDQAAGAGVPDPTVTVGPESTATAVRDTISSGPLLSGELRAAREATVRAKMAGSVLDVTIEEGQSVQRGAVVARIEARPLQDALASSQSSIRSAEQALQVAEREAERTATLVKGGALADRDLELARTAVTGAQAQLADARARLASVRQQLDDAVVTAPISGVVSDRPVNTGDVVSPGTPLVTIIDPSSMRLEASVQSEALAVLKLRMPVEFDVRGYPGQRFEGRIERISPAADPVTRQVTIFVAIPNVGGQLVAGLFAEGRVTTESRVALVVPVSAVELAGPQPWAVRVREGKAERVSVSVGMRDDRRERIEIVAGLDDGDILLTGAAHMVTPGTPIKLTAAKADPATR